MKYHMGGGDKQIATHPTGDIPAKLSSSDINIYRLL